MRYLDRVTAPAHPVPARDFSKRNYIFIITFNYKFRYLIRFV